MILKDIQEESFIRDFGPLSGFYTYHVKNKKISLVLDDIQNFGVKLIPHTRAEMQQIEWDDVQPNSIEFSSWRKSENIKNLMWTLRCLESHAENIKETEIDDTKYYAIECHTKKNEQLITTMKGLIACDLWSSFRDNLKEIITNNSY